MHGTKVMLHVGAHVRVGGVEGGIPRASGVWGKPDQGDVRDDRAATQGRRPAETKGSVLRRHGLLRGTCREPCHAAEPTRHPGLLFYMPTLLGHPSYRV